jgi:CubicO group peptidase (beta-lactamase class C family)
MLVKPDSGEPDSIPAKKEITIRDLLRHTSGITYNWNGDLGAGVASGLLQYEGTIGDSVKKLAGHPLLFNPGDRWEYSLGVDLGRLVDAQPHPMGGLTLDREINGLAYQAITD